MYCRCFCKTSWRRLEHLLARHLEDVLNTSSEDVSLRWIYLSWSRRLKDALKASSEEKEERHLQDIFIKTNVCWEFIWWSNDKLRERINKPIQSCVVMEIRWKIHCQVMATHISTYGSTNDIPVSGEVEEKEERKNLLKGGKFSFYVIVDHEDFTYLKNKK